MTEINVVETWLKTFDLGKYAQSFIDNGYDDLEICKQVGIPDLDAIGVESIEDRNKIIDEIKLLKEKGGTHVYLTLADESQRNSLKSSHDSHVPTRPTLENLLSDVPPPAVPSPGLGARPGSALERSSAATPVTYPKLQLSILLRDKLVQDEIDLASPPYTSQDLSPCWSGLTALAVKYKVELKTHLEDVLDRLEDLRWRRIIYEDAMSIYTYKDELKTHLEDILDRLEDLRWRRIIYENTMSTYTPPSMTSSTMDGDHYNQSVYSYSPRGGPPPIPSVPPPEGSHLPQYDRENYGQLQSVHTRYHDNPSQANYVALDTGMCCIFPKKVTRETESTNEKKKTSTLGRLFRNMGFRRSSRKHSYKKHQGNGDLLAHEITMGDNDRIALMQMVKEGKISTETAIQVVKRFEEERKKEDPFVVDKDKEKKVSNKPKKGNTSKPTKSPSIVYTEETPCEICQCHGFMLQGYPPDEYSRQRRVHSVSHIPYNDPLRSPGAPRAMSCSPMRSQSAQPSAVNSPVSYAQGSKIYTPVIPHELKMFSGHRGHYAVHGIDVLRDRLNVIKTSACVHKTQSKASLISSESDHSMDCAALMASQIKPQVEETYFCSNHSTVSMGSDTDPGANGRRKCGNTMEKQHTHKWQRTGSLSQGEDGMSTDNEEVDDPDQFLLGGGTSSSHMMEKFRGVKNEMRKRILQTRDIIGDGKSQHLCSAYQPAPGTSHSVSSNDSNCSSGVGSQSTHSEPIQRQQKLPPHPWVEPDQGQGLIQGHIVGHARVHSEYTPAPDEKDFLHLRRGEKVQILEASSSGIWKGRIDNRVGYFHFNFVDMVAETTPSIRRKERTYRQSKRRSKPRSVEELLQRINLEHLAPVFVMNGYDNLEIFAEIDHEDLNTLSIFDSESRTKLLTAAELLNDYEVEPVDDRTSRYSRSASATPTSQQYAVPWTSFFPTKPPTTGSRDSGCYDSSEFMNRDNYDPYACINRNRINPNDKENLRPYAKKNVKPDTSLHSDLVELSLNYGANVKHGVTGPTGAKLEKIYSEEDREVCDITGYHSNGTDSILTKVQNLSAMSDVEKLESSLQNRNLTLNIPVLGPDWKVYQDMPSQTSPKYGSMSDSFHSSLDGDLSNVSSSMSASAHGDFFSQSQSTLKKKSKPYARRVAPVVPMRDAQVQVMCPLGLSSPQFSPGSPSVSTPTASQPSDSFVVNPPSSLVLLDSNQSETGQTASLVITENNGPARTSLASQSSQNSREGDSGSDASTVKSDKSKDTKESKVEFPTHISDTGSLQKGFKSIKRSVIPKVTSKLASENIDLSTEPYSTQCGACGIPPLLIQRYAEELKQDLYKTALILDQVRIHKLTTLGRPVVLNDQISESSLGASELKIATIQEFFVSIGLPMYADSFVAKGYTSVESMAVLSGKELQAVCKAEKRHLKRIIHALEWVQNRLSSPSRKQKVSPVKDRV